MNPSCNYVFILLLKYIIMQILCQGSINYLLFITSKYEEKAKESTLLSEMATLTTALVCVPKD